MFIMHPGVMNTEKLGLIQWNMSQIQDSLLNKCLRNMEHGKICITGHNHHCSIYTLIN